ncbi:MAG: nitroreductase family protein [Candidatus Babeliales bacterium]
MVHTRKAAYPILPLILNRWSQRAMSGEQISKEQLMSLFEAARWAPSSFNNQPWRFIYAQKNTPFWDTLFNLLVPFNQQWVSTASILLVVFSYMRFTKTNKPSRTHAFDTGAAVQNLALEAYSQELVVHAMEGFDYDQAYQACSIPRDDYEIHAMLAIGKPGNVQLLNQELQQREEPSDRVPINTLIYEGIFKP